MKVLYTKGKGGGKQHMFVDYLISQGVDVKVVDSAEGIRGLSFDYVIVDEWVKNNIDQQVAEGCLEDTDEH